MRRLSKFAIGFILVLLFSAVVLVLYGYYSNRIQTSGVQHLTGLSGPVTITRDQFGVAHIDAKADAQDAWFALGYAHAQDRLWQIAMQRQIAQGRLSEWFGEATIDTDKILRTLGMYRAAQRDLKDMDPESLQVMHRYVQGINAYIDQGKYPFEFKILGVKPQPITEVDIIAWSKMMSFDMQYMWKYIIRSANIQQQFGQDGLAAFFPAYPDTAPTTMTVADMSQIHFPAGVQHAQHWSQPALRNSTLVALNTVMNQLDRVRDYMGQTVNSVNGSNQWVISGKHTTTGKPILCSDPHLSYQAPAFLYLNELKAPNLHVIGATLPGTPAVVIGHNDHIAWSITNAPINSQELYIVGDDAPRTTIDEVIQVKGAEPITFPVTLTEQGPVISDVIKPLQKGSQTIAMRWIALEPGDTTTASMIQLVHAKNWTEFRQSLSHFVNMTMNFNYADTQGNIGYQMVGRVPVREGWTGQVPVPLDDEHEWSGYIPFDQLPRVYNPERGWIANANNKTAPKDYPYALSFYWSTPPYRISQIESMIKNKIAHGKVDLHDMRDIQGSTVSLFARELVPLLMKTQPQDAFDEQAMAQLRQWDGDMRVDSVASTIFNAWYAHLVKDMINTRLSFPFDKRGVPLMVIDQLRKDGPFCHIKGGANNCAELLSQTLHASVKALSVDLGRNMDRWQWGKIHQAEFKFMGLGQSKLLGWIWNRHIPTGGGNFTPFMGSFDLDHYQSIMGPSYRQIVDLADLDHSQFISTLGQSENIFSKHYADHMKRWAKVFYAPMSSKREDWGPSETLTLAPRT